MKTTSHDYEWHPKFFGVVTGLFCALYMITMTLTPKIVDIFGFFIPAAILTFPLCCILTDVLTEVYGFNRARQAIWTNLACTLLFGLFTQAAIAMKPSVFWPHQQAYETLFATSWRLSLGGCLAWAVGEFLNSAVVSKMKIFQNAKFMPVRFILSTVVGQLFDTIIFVLAAFYGTMPAEQLLVLGVTGWGFKIAYEVFALPLSIPITTWIKRKEGIEHFDKQQLRLF